MPSKGLGTFTFRKIKTDPYQGFIFSKFFGIPLTDKIKANNYGFFQLSPLEEW
jgi:hypothetical protein